MKAYLICDESGAKGYADKSEKYPGETGVFAGFIITDEHIEDLKKDIIRIAIKYFNEEKWHIYSLSNELMELLREEVFDILAEKNLTCMYEAIHVEGFKAEHELHKDLRRIGESNLKSGVKLSSNPNPPSLHESLFQGLFCKALAYFIDSLDENDELIVISDKVDKPIMKKFFKKANDVTDFSPREYKETAYDTKKGEVVRGTIHIKDNMLEQYKMYDIQSANFSVELDTPYDCLTLAADILANSINYIFKSRLDYQIGKPLHNDCSVNQHPLIKQFYGIIYEERMPWTSDTIYMHPRERKKYG